MSNPLKPPALDPQSLPLNEGSSYPQSFRDAVRGRRWRALGDAVGLTQFGVNLGEIWYLSELADYLRAKKRNRFLLTAPPLRLPGAMGSPVTPVATV